MTGADGNPDSRVYAYEVVVVGDEGAPKLYKAVYAAGGECFFIWNLAAPG